MRKVLNIILSIAILTIFRPGPFAQVWQGIKPGADIRALTTSGAQINGELLSVREKSLIILNSSTCENSTHWWECVDQLKKEDIQKLTIEGDSYVLAGIGIGAILGFASLLVTVDFNPNPGGFLNIPKPRSSEGVVIGVCLGCIIAGGIVGLLASSQDEVIEPFSEYDISGLSVYAKYPEDEPKILKQIE